MPGCKSESRHTGPRHGAAGRCLIELVPDATAPAGVRLEWTARPKWNDWARWSEGRYVLRTNIADWSAEDLWRTYMQLTQAAAAFRIHKSDLSLRPIWHQKESRGKAHILVCFLVHVLWKTLEQWQQRAGLGHSPPHYPRGTPAHPGTDVFLPTEHGPEFRLRCVVRPDAAQAALLDRLGLELRTTSQMGEECHYPPLCFRLRYSIKPAIASHDARAPGFET